MSAATASSTGSATVFVRLLDEGVDVWRPVPARRSSEATFRLSDEPVPEHRLEHGVASKALFAVARASDFDKRSQAALVRAG
jgi:hypothetical protein